MGTPPWTREGASTMDKAAAMVKYRGEKIVAVTASTADNITKVFF